MYTRDLRVYLAVVDRRPEINSHVRCPVARNSVSLISFTPRLPPTPQRELMGESVPNTLAAATLTTTAFLARAVLMCSFAGPNLAVFRYRALGGWTCRLQTAVFHTEIRYLRVAFACKCLFHTEQMRTRMRGMLSVKWSLFTRGESSP